MTANGKHDMRIVLQHKETGLYLKDADIWTRDSADALDFVSSTAAIEYCDRNRIDSLQIVLKFDQEKYDIVMQGSSDLDPLRKFRATI